MQTSRGAVSIALILALSATPANGSDLAERPPADDNVVDAVLAACLNVESPCEAARELVPVLLRSPDAASRARAAAALGELRHPDTRAALETAAKFDEDAAVRHAAAAAAKAFGQRLEPADDPNRPKDPDVGRLLYSPTAFPRPEGDLAAKGVALGHWTIDYAVSDEWEVGGQVTIPIMVFNIGPRLRWSREVASKVSVGVAAEANVLLGFSEAAGFRALQYGGGPVVSFGTEDLFASLSFGIHGLHYRTDTSHSDDWLALPSVGFGVRAHRMVKLLVEFYLPFGGDGDGLWGPDGEYDFIFVINYGLRIHGDKFYGDIAFAVPFFENSLQLIEFMPLGYPLLNFGFTI